MEDNAIYWETEEGKPECSIMVDDVKVILKIGDEELIATGLITSTGEKPSEFFERFVDAVSLEEE